MRRSCSAGCPLGGPPPSHRCSLCRSLACAHVWAAEAPGTHAEARGAVARSLRWQPASGPRAALEGGKGAPKWGSKGLLVVGKVVWRALAVTKRPVGRWVRPKAVGTELCCPIRRGSTPIPSPPSPREAVAVRLDPSATAPALVQTLSSARIPNGNSIFAAARPRATHLCGPKRTPGIVQDFPAVGPPWRQM